MCVILGRKMQLKSLLKLDHLPASLDIEERNELLDRMKKQWIVNIN